jgi:hypothetical protein
MRKNYSRGKLVTQAGCCNEKIRNRAILLNAVSNHYAPYWYSLTLKMMEAFPAKHQDRGFKGFEYLQ